MKENKFTRIIAVLLCSIMFCCTSAYAAETRASERIDRSSVTLLKKTNGDLSISFSICATGKMDVIGASSVKIQRNTLTGWVTEYTFTPANSAGIQTTDKVQHSATLTYSPAFTGKEYRVIAMIYVEDTSGMSTKELTSRVVTA